MSGPMAIVGSRSASEYGRRVARDLARGLASHGFTVVSGLARGIDGMAHETALDSCARAPSRFWDPVSIRCLFRRSMISCFGVLRSRAPSISELPIGTKPMAFNFPGAQPFDLAGLSLGVVVVEATEKKAVR
jgi:DNA processing protein